MIITFNADLFSEKLLTKRAVMLRVGTREAAEQIGISPVTLSRVENRHTPDVITFAKCCKWLSIDMHTFFQAT